MEQRDRAMERAYREAFLRYRTSRPGPAIGAVWQKKGRTVWVSILSDVSVNKISGLSSPFRPQGKGSVHSGAGLEKYVPPPGCDALFLTLTPPLRVLKKISLPKRVYLSVEDPRHKTRVLHYLKSLGCRVETGLLAEKGKAFYAPYFYWRRTGRPWVTLKAAQSRDGSLNAKPGVQTAITGPRANAWTHDLRARADVILVGAETLRVDNPRLTARIRGMKGQPDVATITRSGNLPADSHFFREDFTRQQWIFSPKHLDGLRKRKPNARRTGKENPNPNRAGDDRQPGLHSGLPSGVRVEKLPARDPMGHLLKILGEAGCHHLLVEGGASLLSQWLRTPHWNRFCLLTAPVLLPKGQRWARNLLPEWDKSLNFGSFARLGRDVLTEYFHSPRDKAGY